MKVRVRFFASLRETLGTEGVELELPEGASLEAVQGALRERFGPHPLLERCRWAVNARYATRDQALRDGDEVALLPPVAGGGGLPRVALRAEPLPSPEEVRRVLQAGRVDVGAVVLFLGVARRAPEDGPVIRLEYEAYVPMAEAEMARIRQEVLDEHEGRVRDALLYHRIGAVAVGEPSFLVAVAAGHRAEAFAACRAIVDRVKARVPIWKKEVMEDGSGVWVEPPEA